MSEVIVALSFWILRYALFMSAWGRGGHGRFPDQTDRALTGLCANELRSSIVCANGSKHLWVEIFLHVFRYTPKKRASRWCQNRGKRNFISYLSEGFGHVSGLRCVEEEVELVGVART